jgi:hypothetical protein
MKSMFRAFANGAVAAMVTMSIAACGADGAQDGDVSSVPTEPQTVDQAGQTFHPEWHRRTRPPITSTTSTGAGGSTSTPPTPPPACIEFGKACGLAACCPGLTCHFDGYAFWCRF